MVNNIDELPDDIISHILSLLTIRDTLRARLSSSRWLNLPDSRAVIHLTSPNVLGNEGRDLDDSPALQSKFMKIANRFMQVWVGNKMNTLIIRCEVGKEHFGDIDKWIAKAFRMKVELIDIGVTSSYKPKYTFPCTANQHEYKPYLKQLWLADCTPSFLDFGYTSWLSNLTTIYFGHIPLDRQRMNLILSSATNLVSLQLNWCKLGELRINCQLLHLKKLVIIDDLTEVMLKCPSLELLDYCGKLASMRFEDVPVLKEAKIWFTKTNLCSTLFNDLNIQAPSLEALSITIGTEVRPIPPTLSRHSLKELKVVLLGGFDLLSIKYLLNACPCLEVLQVEVLVDDKSKPEIGVIGRREYWDQRQHHKLRKVKIKGFYEHWNAVKLAKYILRNAVVLEEMEIVTRILPFVLEYHQSLRMLQEKINPTARFIVSH